MPELVKSSNKIASTNEKSQKSKPGRPKGSQNKNRQQVELSKYLQFVPATIQSLLNLVNSEISLVYLVFDGAFGNNDALQMVRQCQLHLISKMRHDSALDFPYRGKYSGRGRHRKYGNRVNSRALPKQYLKSYSVEGNIRTDIYQANVWHKLFADQLNVVIIVKTNLTTGKMAHVILFSRDLELSYDQLVESYQLRFQIEFNFRDAKQFWGLEDFMNIKPTQVRNAANLSMFMVELSQALLQPKSAQLGQSINDLKSWFRASKYVEKTLNLLGQNPEPIFIEQLIIQASMMGRINPYSSTIGTESINK